VDSLRPRPGFNSIACAQPGYFARTCGGLHSPRDPHAADATVKWINNRFRNPRRPGTRRSWNAEYTILAESMPEPGAGGQEKSENIPATSRGRICAGLLVSRPLPSWRHKCSVRGMVDSERGAKARGGELDATAARVYAPATNRWVRLHQDRRGRNLQGRRSTWRSSWPT
jgi:hypothetical protein